MTEQGRPFSPMDGPLPEQFPTSAIVARHIPTSHSTPAAIVLLTGPGWEAPEGFLAAAAATMATDPRIATVSWRLQESGRAPQAHLGQSVIAAAPWGPVVAVNPAASGLVALPSGEVSASQSEWLDWCLQANHRGLRHVWLAAPADSTAITDGAGFPLSQLDELELRDESSALATFVRSIERPPPLTVAVDAEWLGPYETGAQVVVVEMVSALAKRDDVAEIRLCNLPPSGIPGYADRLITDPKVVVGDPECAERADIYWRPQQPEMASLTDNDRERGRRIVATVLDLISYANRRYHGSDDILAELHRHVRAYLEGLDGITAISRDVAQLLLAEVPGVSAARVGVTPLGVEHLTRALAPRQQPGELEGLGPEAAPFLLVLGNDFMHKNRDFAVKVWREVSGTHKVDLVLAGLHVGQGSAEEYERPLRTWKPKNGARLHRFESVSTEAKTWLLANAAVVLYPTAAEGFGFVPFEAASLGTAPVVTRFGPLAENLPREVGVSTWALDDYVAEVVRLLDSHQARQEVVAAVNRAGEGLTWDRSAECLMAAFRDALRRPPQPHLAVPWSQDCPVCRDQQP